MVLKMSDQIGKAASNEELTREAIIKVWTQMNTLKKVKTFPSWPSNSAKRKKVTSTLWLTKERANNSNTNATFRSTVSHYLTKAKFNMTITTIVSKKTRSLPQLATSNSILAIASPAEAQMQTREWITSQILESREAYNMVQATKKKSSLRSQETEKSQRVEDLELEISTSTTAPRRPRILTISPAKTRVRTFNCSSQAFHKTKYKSTLISLANLSVRCPKEVPSPECK